MQIPDLIIAITDLLGLSYNVSDIRPAAQTYDPQKTVYKRFWNYLLQLNNQQLKTVDVSNSSPLALHYLLLGMITLHYIVCWY